MKSLAFNNFKFANILPVITESSLFFEKILVVLSSNLLYSLMCLKKHYGYQYKVLSCISGVDLMQNIYRFSVVYDILSITYNNRLRIKIFTDSIAFVPSICNIFKCANWWEREVWDMFGIWFEKHPDLRRILTDYGFDGFPLRKDFPLSGYLDICYSVNKRRIIFQPLELTQEFRSFSFENAW